MSHSPDILIIGAGISGIGMAYHLQQKCPQKTYVILEGRDALGGTWDLFRYPGIRSDSNMLTMAYGFKPWGGTETTASGGEILDYVRETARENGIDKQIHYGQKVTRANWSSDSATWTVQTESGDTYICNFLLNCAGYYSYESGYAPDFAGQDTFKGKLVHPQKWPNDIDYANKKVVVIGSGATAVTLVPKLAEKAAHVIMLQRSPSYMRPMPNEDPFVTKANKFLPAKMAFRLARWRTVAFGQYFYHRARTQPQKVKQLFRDMMEAQLPADYDIDTHFTPEYDPWDQRVCLVPDGDLFQAIRAGTASVVTDHIDTFTADGILLKSGETLEADIIITATGLNLAVMGGINFVVDDEPIDFAETVTYKGMMFSDVPNMVYMFGYIAASWTLGVDLTADYVTRLLNHMDKKDNRQCTPHLPNVAQADKKPWIENFTSGYMTRSMHLLPKQTGQAPWVNTQQYLQDRKIIGRAPIDDGNLLFKK